MIHIDYTTDTNHALTPVVATLGFFDGVHIGHRFLIDQVKQEAAQRGLPSAVITFPVHPRKVLQKDYQPKLLCGLDEKIEQLRTTGIDYCIVLPFTVELSRLTAKEFMRDVLKKQLLVDTLVVGYDHRFGRDREEGLSDYIRFGCEEGINVIEARELRLGESDVSSSQIRRLLKEGNILMANKMLSYRYNISGKIVEGYQVGRTIGFPTANIKVWEKYKVIPALGVYAVLVHIADATHKGMLYIGTRPTLHRDSDISVEVNIFDFSGNLYNQSLTVEFIDFIRHDMKFEGVEPLIEQIRLDKQAVKERLASEG